MGFREQFEKMAPGPTRDDFIYKAIIAQGPPKQLVPVTVNGPNNTKITYKVMPDYITIENIRVPLTGATAQRVANHFGMSLPTTKMDKQIWQAADTKLKPSPMSGGATIGGKYYTGDQVVSHKINTSDTSIAFNEKINKQLQDVKEPTLIAGHMKSIVQPDDPSRLGLTGWYNSDGTPIQKGNISAHDTQQHSEYAAGTRLVSDKVTITKSDGSVFETTMDKLLADPTMGKAITLSSGGPKKYETKPSNKPITPSSESTDVEPAKSDAPAASSHTEPVSKPQSMADKALKQVNDFLGQFGIAASSNYLIKKNERLRALKKLCSK